VTPQPDRKADIRAAMSNSSVPPSSRRPRPRRMWWSANNISGIYVWIAIICLFGVWRPSLFLTQDAAKEILNQSGITGIVALSLVVPLASGLFDLSIGATVGLTAIGTTWLLQETSWSVGPVILVALAMALVVGLVNALVVVGFGIDSFIGTLAMGGIIDAIGIAISGNQTLGGRIAGQPGYDIAGLNFYGITAPVFYMFFIMVVMGIVLERFQVGRFWYAIGYDREVARLAGIRVKTAEAGSLIVSSLLAGAAGILLAGRLGTTTPLLGDAYLLPAFAAVFLGSTQFRPGRYNAWGTVLAVLLLGTGQYGLILVGAPQWSPNVFQGAALIIAVGVIQLTKKGGPGPGRLSERLLRRRRLEEEKVLDPDSASTGVPAGD
jgi:ribose transport system permease protein